MVIVKKVAIYLLLSTPGQPPDEQGYRSGMDGKCMDITNLTETLTMNHWANKQYIYILLANNKPIFSRRVRQPKLADQQQLLHHHLERVEVHHQNGESVFA